MFLSRLAAPATLAAAIASTGCSVLLKTDAEQCTVDKDCTARGAEFAGTVCKEKVCVTPAAPPDPKWSCIGKVEPLMSGGMVTLKVQLVDLVTENPANGLTVKLCKTFDPDCMSPISTPTPDAMGFVSVTVASDFQGFLEVTDASMYYYNALVFLDPVATPENEVFLVVPTSQGMTFAKGANVSLDTTAGIVTVRTADCQSKPSAGVSVTLAPHGGETPFFVFGSVVTTDGTETDLAGNAGFVNVTPGAVNLVATLGPGGKEIGKVSTLARANTLTFQILGPTPL
jgi:hypothetical protein